jgi:hypothetical protein
LRRQCWIIEHQQVLGLWFCAAAVKLKLPVVTLVPSMTMTLLWAMATLVSTQTGIPAFVR